MVQNLVQPGLIQGLLFIHLGSGTVRHIVEASWQSKWPLN